MNDGAIMLSGGDAEGTWLRYIPFGGLADAIYRGIVSDDQSVADAVIDYGDRLVEDVRGIPDEAAEAVSSWWDKIVDFLKKAGLWAVVVVVALLALALVVLRFVR